MTRGDFFGELALLYNCVRTASIIAVSDVKCVAVGREKLTKALDRVNEKFGKDMVHFGATHESGGLAPLRIAFLFGRIISS